MQPKQVNGPTIFHLELSQGMDHEFKFQYVDESTLLPIDLTGWKADMYVRLTSGHPQVLKSLTSSLSSQDGYIDLDSNGNIVMGINSQFTTQIPWSDGVYDIVLTNPDLQKTKLIRGKVNVYNTITFPQNYIPQSPGSYSVLTVGMTKLPGDVELYGYMNPIKLGLGGGLLLTGDLRPTFYENLEIVELSYTGGRLRVAFLGNVMDNTFQSMKLGTVPFYFSDSSGRVFSPGAAQGVGLTYWEWVPTFNPFLGSVNSGIIVQFEIPDSEMI